MDNGNYSETRAEQPLIEIEDFNMLISGIKKREENIIHILDQTIKA